MRTRRTRIVVIAAVAVAAAVLGTAAPALAEHNPFRSVDYSVVEVTAAHDAVDHDHPIVRCEGTVTSCEVTAGMTARVTIGTALGASRNEVAAALGVTADASVTITGGFTGTFPTAGRVSGYPLGERYRYRVAKTVRVPLTGKVLSSETSDWLEAFVPDDNAVAFDR